MPVDKFWSLTIYDMVIWAFIYTPEERPGISSHERGKMKINTDGSVDIYFGRKAPDGYKNNWISTGGNIPVPRRRCSTRRSF